MRVRSALLFVLFATITASAGGQVPNAIDPALLAGVPLRAIGPTSVGGRIDDFAVGRAFYRARPRIHRRSDLRP